MFFVKKLRRDILLEPCYIGAKLKEKVKQRVMNELEGQCLGKHGYVISVLDIDDGEIYPGQIDNDTGSVNVTVWYSAIFLRPFRNEVIDTVVITATDENGFFTRVGPLQIFVSRHAMPEDMKFNHASGDCWISEDETVEIREGSVVRLRIIGI
jgi:DNA-directed RNA polymerase II subunit RPB7